MTVVAGLLTVSDVVPRKFYDSMSVIGVITAVAVSSVIGPLRR